MTEPAVNTVLGEGREGLNVGALALFTSLGTLLCCALPIVLVMFGFGSVVAAVTMKVPVLVTLSEYKAVMFGFSAALLGLSGRLLWWRQKCPADAALAARCHRANALGKRVFWTGAVLWLTGLAAAYLLLPLRLWLDF